MGMKKGEKIERWIDLSGLPRNKKGQIAWQESIGIKIPFRYDTVYGNIELIEYVGYHKYNILIYIYNRIIQYCLSSTLIKNCNLGYAIKQPVGVTHPELVKYFENEDDAFKYSAYYTKSVNMICPICGYKKQQTVELLTSSGFSCPICSDGKSYAEKLMFNILTQLNVDFKNEVSKKYEGFEWAKNYRYDFYFNINNHKYLIEMDGHFHDGSKFHSYKEARFVDENKDNLAYQNGFDIIRIDCRYPNLNQRFEYIKNNILQSDLCKLLDLTLVDWNIADKQALNSNIKRAADLFNNGVISTKKIGEILGISRNTVRKYLKIATEIGWCKYVIINRKPLDNIKPIALFKDDKLVGAFIGASELSYKSKLIYGVDMDIRAISAVCNGKTRRKRIKGYIPKYITYDEYKQILPQFLTTQNECSNLQEVI